MNHNTLKNMLDYCHETGVFTWATASGNVKPGDRAGSYWGNGYGNTYIRIKILGKSFFAHRLAWLYMTGSFPDSYIDHIDHDGTNNAFSNLRLASNETNQKNVKISSLNKTGISGVCFVTRSKKWHAWVSADKKQIHLGSFVDFFEACCARKSAEINNGYHPNNGMA